jgi:superfamily II DNA/RNA helicase
MMALYIRKCGTLGRNGRPGNALTIVIGFVQDGTFLINAMLWINNTLPLVLEGLGESKGKL